MRYPHLYGCVILMLAVSVVPLRAESNEGQSLQGAPPPLSAPQQQAVTALREYGGVLIHRSARMTGNPVVLVDFTNHRGFRDEWLKHLAVFPELREVGLVGTALTDAGLEWLQQTPQLQTLTLNETGVTDSGLAKLSACARLQTLDVRGTRVSAAGLAALQRALPKLEITSDFTAQAIAEAAGTETRQKPVVPDKGGTPASETVRFKGATIAKSREQAAEIALPPEKTPAGWSKSLGNPAKMLEVFPALRIREGFTLRAYQFKEEGNGNGFVWAMPKDAEFPAPADCPRLENHFLKAPKPYDALDDVMEAIEGPDTADAYLQASLLRRELKDFGGIWHGLVWGPHYILDEDPLKKVADKNADPMRTPRTKPHEWKWLEPRPSDWAPRVTLEKDRATVTFYSYNGYEKERIYRHVDIYRRGKFRPRVEEAKIAEGKAGYAL